MDKHIKTEGIILRRINLNEADQIVTVLTKDLGKISILAKGSRRFKSKFSGRLELFSQAQFTCFSGASMHHLNEVDIVRNRSLFDIPLKTQSMLFYIVEITSKLLADHQEAEAIYELLSLTLDEMSAHEDKNELILYAYLIKLFTELGFMASWRTCSRSNEELNLREPLYLCVRDVTVIRSGFATSADIRLATSVIKWVNFMQKYDYAEILRVAPSKGERDQVWTIIKMVLQNILFQPIKSEEFMIRVN